MPAFTLTVLTCLALTGEPVPDASDAATATTALSGKLREVSGALGRPRAVLVADDGRTWVLRGREGRGQEGELRRLAGARVRLEGAFPASSERTDEGIVDRYEILELGDGVVPRVGTLAALELGGARRLLFIDARGEAELLPAGSHPKLVDFVGSKLWVVGARAEGLFRIRRYGILAPAHTGRPQERPGRAP